ncbi:MAG: metallophosphoesterase [Planctomycetes bacterium]|nr:metallophosphoesterase [Planctomycetota bacterium]
MITRRLSLAAAIVLAGAACMAQDEARRRTFDPAAGRDLPPVVVPPAKEGVTYLRALVMGDWGTGRPSQRDAAAAMATRARQEPVDLIITTGDNFYPRGVTSTDDPQWKTKFEDVYTDPALQVPIYPSLGNHDWMGDVEAQVAYSQTNPRWRLPARYHAKRFPADGEALLELFVIDTQALLMREADPEQREWLDRALGRSTARWKVVVGHHPIHSHGRHGSSRAMAERLEPLLVKHQVDLYMAGHDHTLEMLRPVQGVHHLVSGGAGGPDMSYAIEWTDDAYYAATGGGFVALRIGPDELVIEFLRMDGRTQFAHTLIKGASGPF